MMATVSELAITLTDAALSMFQSLVGRANLRAKKRLEETIAASAEQGRVRLLRIAEVLEAVVTAVRSEADVAVAVDSDFSLHRTIVELSGNRRLLDQYLMVEQQIRLFINSTYASAPNLSVAIAHHSPIVDAILAGDGEAAAGHSEHHVLSEGERVLAMVDNAG